MNQITLLTSIICFALMANAQDEFHIISAPNMAYAVDDIEEMTVHSLIGQAFVSSVNIQELDLSSGMLPTVPSVRVPELSITISVVNEASPGEALDLSIVLTAEVEPDSALIYYRRAGEELYQSTNLLITDMRTTVTVPPSYMTERGAEYFINFYYGAEVVTYPETNAAQRPAEIRVNIDAMTSPQVFQPKLHHMISLPGESTHSIFAQLEDDLGEYGIWTWRLFRYEDEHYYEHPELPESVLPGTAYWLVSQFDVAIDFENLISTPSVEPIVVVLAPGWNQIANPYVFPVDWSTVTHSSVIEPPSYFDGTSNVPGVETLLPWEGYWVYNNGNVPETIYFNSIESPEILAAGASFLNPLHDGEYTLQLSARTEEGSNIDQFNYVGVRNAESGGSGSERVELHAAPHFVQDGQVSILLHGEPHDVSFELPSSEGHYWDIEVELPPTQESLHLDWKRSGHMRSQHQMYLLDIDLAYPIDISKNSTKVERIEGQDYRKLKLIVGNSSFAEAQSGGITLEPTEFNLKQNFPNPFNPETTIAYDLKFSSHVKLDIYNALGQHIRTLTRGVQNAGSHAVVWDGTGAEGQAAASGIYFYQLVVHELTAAHQPVYRQNKKMVLLR